MTEEKSMETYKISLTQAWSLSKSWKRAAIIWRTLDHFFSVGSFASSVAVIFISGISNNASNPSVINIAIICFSSLAALLTLTGFACNPTKYMTNYRMAFQILNQALVENTDENGGVIDENSFGKIRDAITKGEHYIGRTFDVNNCNRCIEQSETQNQLKDNDNKEDNSSPTDKSRYHQPTCKRKDTFSR